MARCHRIGQTRPVLVLRFCIKDTIDEIIIKRAAAKRFLEKAIIVEVDAEAGEKKRVQQFEQLLKEQSVTTIGKHFTINFGWW